MTIKSLIGIQGTLFTEDRRWRVPLESELRLNDFFRGADTGYDNRSARQCGENDSRFGCSKSDNGVASADS